MFNALSEFNGNKASGPNGFYITFWQCCWDFVKEEVLGSLRNFMSRAVL